MFPTLALQNLASRLDALLVDPAHMQFLRGLVQCCLASPEGHVDSIEFPLPCRINICEPAMAEAPEGTEPTVTRDPDDNELTSGQMAVALAALHDVHCPGAVKVVAGTNNAGSFDETGKMAEGYPGYVRWRAIRDRVRNLDDSRVGWFTSQLSQLERMLREHNSPPPTTPEPSGQTGPCNDAVSNPPPSPPNPVPQATRSLSESSEINQKSLALALLFQHPQWSVAKIAQEIGVNRQTLYGWSEFREAATRIGRMKPGGPKERPPRRGHKTKDGRIEAYADEPDGVVDRDI